MAPKPDISARRALKSPKTGGVKSRGHRVNVYPLLESIPPKPKPIPLPPKGVPLPATPVPPAASRSRLPLYIGGLGIYAVAVYGAYLYLTSSSGDPANVKPLDEQRDRSHVFDNIAKKYDGEIGNSEFFMGLPLLRRSLAKRAQGDVLEASAGTGRNIKYFKPKKMNSLTMVDCSAPMLEQAREAFHKRHPRYKHVSFIQQDAAAPIRSPTGGKFDTVVQTMGICSHHSPKLLLRSLGDACKNDGNIILLEHGRSHYDWLNRILDRYAEKHADTWGCWWNRDIEGIVSESGLRIQKIKRYHFGTTYWIEARPPISDDEKKSTVLGK